MVDLIEQATIAFDQREEWCSKLDALKKRADIDLILHSEVRKDTLVINKYCLNIFLGNERNSKKTWSLHDPPRISLREGAKKDFEGSGRERKNEERNATAGAGKPVGSLREYIKRNSGTSIKI